MTKNVPITYFSDVLCIWAFIAQLRVEAIKATYGDQVRFEPRFCSVFGDTTTKITTTWRGKGEYDGFNAHLRHAVAAFPEVRLNPDVWLVARPASSTGVHLFLKAVQLAEMAGDVPQGSADVATWAMRRAFFEEARDIATSAVQGSVAEQIGLSIPAIEAEIRSGQAFAALASDY